MPTTAARLPTFQTLAETPPCMASEGVDLQRLATLRLREPAPLGQWLGQDLPLLRSENGRLSVFDPQGVWPDAHVPPLNSHLVIVALAPATGCCTWLPGEGSQQRDLAEGDALVLPAGEPGFIQWPAAANANATASALVLGLHPQLLFQADSGRAATARATQPTRLYAQSAVHAPVLHGLALTLQRAALQGDPAAPAVADHVARALAVQLLVQQARHAAGERSPRAGGEERSPHGERDSLGQVRLARALSFLASRIDQPVDLAEAAQAAGCSLHHFAHLFKTAMGVSPMRYLRQQRMQRARELVETTGLSMAEIGDRVGMPDPARFSQAFRAYWKTTPSALRRPG